MTTLAVVGGRVVGPTGDRPATVVIQDGTIAGVVADDRSGAAARSGASLDASGLLVAPGFVDLQCNGGHGIDLSRQPERLWDLAALLPRYGVTSFLPTIVTSPPGVIDRAQQAIGRRPSRFVGTEPLGLHLEGPMLNPARRGAHDAHHLRPPSPELVAGWCPRSGVAMVTLAPELPGALEVVRMLRGQGVVVAAGHTDATAEEARAGVDAGITAVTHLFNAMAPFHHRQPGVAGIALSDDRVTAGVIADGRHVHPAAVAAAWAALGPRLALVTDAVAAMGVEGADLPDGARTVDGRLAGGLVAMDQAVRNLVGFSGCPPHAAIACASATAAGLLGADTKGAVVAGRDADLVLLTPPPQLEVVVTLVGGRVLFDRQGRFPGTRPGRTLGASGLG